MSFTRAGSTPSTEKEVGFTRWAPANTMPLRVAWSRAVCDRVVDGRVQGVVHHHLQDEVDAAAEVQPEPDLARAAPRARRAARG